MWAELFVWLLMKSLLFRRTYDWIAVNELSAAGRFIFKNGILFVSCRSSEFSSVLQLVLMMGEQTSSPAFRSILVADWTCMELRIFIRKCRRLESNLDSDGIC